MTRRLAVWLGIAAIALQTGWPLLGALPRSMALVPLCTVDGVTHYLEVPTGKSPLEAPAGQGEHCAFCWIGAASLACAFPGSPLTERAAAQRFAAEPAETAPSFSIAASARAPPFSQVVTSSHRSLGRDDEEALLAGGARRAPDRGRILRLGLLHHQH